jgi:hypothetical protein
VIFADTVAIDLQPIDVFADVFEHSVIVPRRAMVRPSLADSVHAIGR